MSYNFEDTSLASVSVDQAYGILGATVWDTAIIMAKWLEFNCDQTYFEGKTFLELGSGTGILGLIVARLGGNVIVTDKHDETFLTDLLKENLKVKPFLFVCFVFFCNFGGSSLVFDSFLGHKTKQLST